MKNYYATIECPRCRSTSRFKLTTLPTGPLLCPVCSEGEIELNISLQRNIRNKSKFPFELSNLLTEYQANY
jgi:hypothetical protein